MNAKPKNLYLDLLKQVLTGYLYIDSPYANGIPLELVAGKSWLKGLRNWLLVKFLRRSRMLVIKCDHYSAKERRERRKMGVDWPILHADTMVGLKRLDNLQTLIEDVLANGVAGDLIETGVWRGGASIFMRAVLMANGDLDRKIWICDSFEGLPPPEPGRFPADAGDPHHTYDFLAISQEEVVRNFDKYGLLDDRVEFVKGYFEDTLMTIPAKEFAVLRLDGDMYGSTMVALEALYPKLSAGGYVIIDDFCLGPCRQAVQDFREANGIVDAIVDIDSSGAFWHKS